MRQRYADKKTLLTEAAKVLIQKPDLKFTELATKTGMFSRIIKSFPGGKEEIVLSIFRDFWSGYLFELQLIRMALKKIEERFHLGILLFANYVMSNQLEFSVIRTQYLPPFAVEKYENKPDLKALRIEVDGLKNSVRQELMQIIKEGQDCGELDAKTPLPVIYNFLVGAIIGTFLEHFPLDQTGAKPGESGYYDLRETLGNISICLKTLIK